MGKLENEQTSFDDFFNHENKIIKGLAVTLGGLKESLNKGDITKSEFEELANDILEYERVDDLSSDLDQQVMIKEAVDIFKVLVKGITRI